jgi:hypothetical protein
MTLPGLRKQQMKHAALRAGRERDRQVVLASGLDTDLPITNLAAESARILHRLPATLAILATNVYLSVSRYQ